MSDTPETDAAQFGTGRVSVNFARRLERERDEAMKDLEFQRGLYKVQEEYLETARRERDEAINAIRETLKENRHLADGDDCTLRKLKAVVPYWK